MVIEMITKMMKMKMKMMRWYSKKMYFVLLFLKGVGQRGLRAGPLSSFQGEYLKYLSMIQMIPSSRVRYP